ncbi:MAG: S1-like domain-containing RNA-binding protein [Lachnospiraceae bacterium]|nr:S1-like domain-containing RNA-binding protein [Lachnospiraceae bacterium]
MELGKIQSLEIIKEVEFGVYLARSDDPEERVLLPKKQVPEGARVGDELEVFLYKDSQDRLIATTTEPFITLGGLAKLKVKEVTKIGAFLDWGLAKDLLLPFRQQTRKVRAGEECLVALYIDRSDCLCATMNVYEYLSLDSPYRKDDHVKGTIYQISENFGAFVAVDDRWSGLIPKREFYGEAKIGDLVEARVTGVKSDGKLDLSLREKAYLQSSQDAERVMQVLEEYGGEMPFSDRTSSEIIREKFSMSKNAFKRAVGHLLKEERIDLSKDSIWKK